jgi:magnesium transporter
MATWLWRSGIPVDDAVDLDRLPAWMADPANLAWLDLTEPTAVELGDLAAHLGLDATAIEDVQTAHERVKLHRYPGYWFITAYATSLDDQTGANGPNESFTSRLVRSQVSCFVLPRAIITIHEARHFDCQSIRDRLTDPILLRSGVGVFLHALLDDIVDGHFETLQVLDDAVEATEDTVFKGPVEQGSFSRRIHQLRSEVVQLRRIALPLREVVAAIQRHRMAESQRAVPPPVDARQLPADPVPAQSADPPAAPTAPPDVGIDDRLNPLFDDLYDHVLRAMEWADGLRDTISSIFETNLALQDARLNQIMKRLAGWAAVIAIPTAVTGWFGQNLPFWGFNSVSGVITSTTLIVSLSGGTYALLRHYDWI